MPFKKKILTYKITVHKDTDVSEKFFTKTVEDILTDKRTWKKHKFVNITNSINKNQKPDFQIILCKPEVIRKTCKFYGLSCTNMRTKIMWINSHRFKRGAKKSGYSLKDYRIYLINHEVGHILGHGHRKCSTKSTSNSTRSKTNRRQPVPVMNQATKGIGKCKPNVWPLAYEN